jgi:hypothetical protein
MSDLLGPSNILLDYVYVLAIYGALFLLMRHGHRSVELNFKRSYWILFLGWSISVFIGNYILFRIGLMSFLPWLNNFIHTFIWIGLCLGFLYAGSHRKPLIEQFALFAIYSFIVKRAEREILGTWEMDHFLFIRGNMAYIIGWSLMDGLYPVISLLGLKVVAKYVKGVVTE